jgi:hypothetical protein
VAFSFSIQVYIILFSAQGVFLAKTNSKHLKKKKGKKREIIYLNVKTKRTYNQLFGPLSLGVQN